jgi:hypothetical protein
MKQRPILFSTPMVQAILEGRKTMTRRVIKPQPETTLYDVKMGYWSEYPNDLKHPYVKCKHGEIGDVLYVRETWRKYLSEDGNEIIDFAADDHEMLYLTDGDGFQVFNKDGSEKFVPYRPGIHLPKKHSRIWLRITDIRVEKLQDISEEDAKKEGVNSSNYTGIGVDELKVNRYAFRDLWDKINGDESWLQNPWVWVISFERIEKPENI